MAVVEPLGLEMVAGSLLPEHDVRLIDLLHGVELHGSAARFAPDACGISCSFTVDIPRALRIAHDMKRLRHPPFVFVGGHHASLNPQDLASPFIDAVVVGEGEETARELIRAVDAGAPLEKVPGLVLNVSERQRATAPRPLIPDLGQLPLPARHLTAGRQRRYHLGLRGPLASLETARGCPFKCTFCSVWRFFQGQIRLKDPERVVEEIESIENRNIFVTDDNFLASIGRAEAIADLLLRRGIRKRFIIQARTDSIARHPDTVAKLREAGFATVFLGLEKIDSAEMRRIRKGNTVEANEQALAVLKKAGVNIFGTLIVDPDYDERDFARLRDYVRYHAVPNAWFTILTPLPGTSLFDQLQEALTTRDPELFDLMHAVVPTKLALGRFYREFARLYAATYSPRSVAQRSWNAMFNRQGRSLGNLPSPALLWESLKCFRCVANPREYLLAHTERGDEQAVAALLRTTTN
jgi:hopanoid C-3 methylase